MLGITDYTNTELHSVLVWYYYEEEVELQLCINISLIKDGADRIQVYLVTHSYLIIELEAYLTIHECC